MKTQNYFLFLGMAMLFSACGRSDLPQYSKLDRLRILAIHANNPEIQNPAAGVVNVNITPYLSDLGGSGNVTLTLQSCLDTGISVGGNPTCEGALTASTAQTVTVTAPGGQADGTFGTPERTGAPSTGAITVGLNIPNGLLSDKTAAIKNNGLAYLVTVTAQSSSATVRSFRRIIVSTKSPNTNPTLTNLLGGATALTAKPTGDVELSFQAGSSPEAYLYYVSDDTSVSRNEVFEVTWFVSDGEVLSPRTKAGETTTWTAPENQPVGRKMVLAGVLRDGRGGIAVIIRTLN